MNKEELIKIINGNRNEFICRIEEKYGYPIPEKVRTILVSADTSAFADDWRLLSKNEMENPNQAFEAEFVENGFLPIIDIYDGNYIVYMFSEKRFAKLNIFDMCDYEYANEIEEFI